jgi:RNA polymerase sigma-70 factor, ECF subfamily
VLSAARGSAARVAADVGPPPPLAVSQESEPSPVAGPDPESRAWVTALAADDHRADDARRRLHDLLLRAARFEIKRRRGGLRHLRGGDFDDLAHQSADDALMAIMRKLDDYRGESRFTTWAYKFALLEAAVKLRRRAWQGREIPLDAEQWATVPDRNGSPAAGAESREVLAAIGDALETELTPHQRDVLVAVALNEVPIDVLAERLNTTRGALYKTIHDARKKLRSHLAGAGLRTEGEAQARESRS